MIAQLTVRGGTGIVGICAPTVTGTWTSIDRQERRDRHCPAALPPLRDGRRRRRGELHVQLPDRRLPGRGRDVEPEVLGEIVAYIDAANQANPINIFGGQANASSLTATAPSVTTTVANTRLLTFVGAATGTANVNDNWSGLVDEEPGTRPRRARGPPSRTSSGFSDEAIAATGATGTRTGTNAVAAVNIGQAVAIAPLAADGSGTLTTPTSSVVSQSTGNTITFTYTAATGGMRNGQVTIVVPTGWTAPSITGANAGYTTSSTGTVGVAPASPSRSPA